MKALVKYELGALNVKVMEVEKPKISPDEVLIKVMGAGICGTHIQKLKDNI